MDRIRFKVALSGVLFAVAFAGPALAQQAPSAQQLINQLKPTGSLSDTSRGIRPITPNDIPAPGPQKSAAVKPAVAVGAAVSQAAPVVAQAAPAAPSVAPVKPSASLVVDFASGSAVLTPQAKATLDQLGKALTSPQLSAYNFKIVGHTDTTGTVSQNQILSEQRAEAVRTYLESKFNVAASRLQADGVGEADLAVQTPPNTPNRQNRRVQIINIGA